MQATDRICLLRNIQAHSGILIVQGHRQSSREYQRPWAESHYNSLHDELPRRSDRTEPTTEQRLPSPLAVFSKLNVEWVL